MTIELPSEWFTDDPEYHKDVTWGNIAEAVLPNGKIIQGELHFYEEWSEDDWWWVWYIAQPSIEEDVAIYNVEKWRLVS